MRETTRNLLHHVWATNQQTGTGPVTAEAIGSGSKPSKGQEKMGFFEGIRNFEVLRSGKIFIIINSSSIQPA